MSNAMSAYTRHVRPSKEMDGLAVSQFGGTTAGDDGLEEAVVGPGESGSCGLADPK